MWLQVQEMLHIERGGEAQIADELAAYNPMIPNGSEISATVMIEIEDDERRHAALSRLGGIEHKMFLTIAGDTVRGLPDPTLENTSPEGKASSVQFIKFPLSPAQKEKFRAAGTQVVVGIDHSNYAHMAVMPESVRQALAADLEWEAVSRLTHVLVGVDAPDLVAAEPAADIRGLDPAPGAAAFQELGDDARLGARHDIGSGIGIEVERPHGAAHDHATALGEHALMHPSLGALPVRILRQTSDLPITSTGRPLRR
jgi:hypothetical protein